MNIIQRSTSLPQLLKFDKSALCFYKDHDLESITEHERSQEAAQKLVHSARALAQSTEESDIKEAILLYKQVLEHCHTLKDAPDIDFLDDWIEALFKQYQIHGTLDLLDEALCLYEVVLRQRREGHPLHSKTLAGHASLHDIIMGLVDGSDSRGRVIAHYRQILSDIPSEDERYNICLTYLAIALHRNFTSTGGTDVLNEAVKLLRLALDIQGSQHPFREITLDELGVALLACFREKKNSEILDEVIRLHTENLDLRQPGHPRRDVTLHNLGVVHLSKFEQDGSKETLDAMLYHFLAALKLRPKGHPFRSLTLSGVGCYHQLVFDYFNDKAHLAHALVFMREVLELNPPGTPSRDKHLNNLAICLRTNFEFYGEIEKLAESINLHREALVLRPTGHPFRSSTLYNLGTTLEAAYTVTNIKEYLLESIQLLRESLGLRPKGHATRHNTLSSLGNALTKYHLQYGGSESILLEAIDCLRESISLLSLGETVLRDFPRYTLTTALFALYGCSRDKTHLEEVLSIHTEDLKLRKEGHPKRADTQFKIAEIVFQTEGSNNWRSGFDHLLQAITDPFNLPRSRLREAKKTMNVVESEMKSGREDTTWDLTILEAYSRIIELLPQVAHLGLDPISRLRELAETEHLCRIAATRALLLSQLPYAVEILEEGRNLFWTQALRLRSTDLFTDLPDEERRHFEELLEALNTSASETRHGNQPDLDGTIECRRHQNEEIQKMLRDVRSRPGFDRFLRIESFERLTRAATQGPVVVLLTSHLGCHALTILNGRGETNMVELDSVRLEWLSKLRIRCIGAGLRDGDIEQSLVTEGGGPIPRLGIKSQKPVISTADTPTTILEEIWRNIVWPVFQSLGLKKQQGRDRPRLHWCPVGDFTFLPLHAAGKYVGQDKACVSDFVVSSYTPSLSTLIKARKGYDPIPKKDINTVVLSETGATGCRPLPYVVTEAETVARQMKLASVDCFIETAPRIDTTMAALPSAHILHLACHGFQKEQALQSHFALHDGPLTISMLAKLELPQAVLAFLSACETAKGDESQPDQAMHLAASLLFCGFRSVIGTMWTMHDADGPVIAKAVYGELLRKETLELDDIPYALDAAVQALRSNNASVARWATFVHMGA